MIEIKLYIDWITFKLPSLLAVISLLLFKNGTSKNFQPVSYSNEKNFSDNDQKFNFPSKSVLFMLNDCLSCKSTCTYNYSTVLCLMYQTILMLLWAKKELVSSANTPIFIVLSVSDVNLFSFRIPCQKHKKVSSAGTVIYSTYHIEYWQKIHDKFGVVK